MISENTSYAFLCALGNLTPLKAEEAFSYKRKKNYFALLSELRNVLWQEYPALKKKPQDRNFALKFSLKTNACLLRYLIPKKTGHISPKITKNRLFFNILYLEKETIVVAANCETL
jgi:hypothetical protein